MTVPEYMNIFSECLALLHTAIQICESSAKQTGQTRTVMTGYSRPICRSFLESLRNIHLG